MKKAKQPRKKTLRKSNPATTTTSDNLNRRTRRQILKTVAGALIGGAVAGPVGVAAGAIVGASVRRGPVRKKSQRVVQKKTPGKVKTPKKPRADRQRFVNIYPNIP